MGDLEFEQQAFVELLSEDGLIILARYYPSLCFKNIETFAFAGDWGWTDCS